MSSFSQSEFTAYHMKSINRFRWTCLSRSVIYEDAATGYSIKSSPILCQLLFLTYFINTLGKLIFLAFLITDKLGPIEFLDRICGMDYLLCGGMVVLSYNIWQRYPLYEIIYRLWEVENRIYRCLGSPREMKWEAEERHAVTVWAHTILTCVGCCSLTIQFYMAPKYCVFTYSLLEKDNSYLRIIFCFHEVLFLSHAWFAMACSNGLCSFEAVNLSNIIKQMSKAMDELANNERVRKSFSIDIAAEGHEDDVERYERKDGESVEMKRNSLAFRYFDETITTNKERNNEDVKRENRYERIRAPSNHFKNTRKSSSANTGQYNFRNILYDYRQLMLISERFNEWIGYRIVFLSFIACCQYISSTTMAFQVLRMPGTGISDIVFYIQDCTVAVYVNFRVFEFMSIVLPASEQFLNSMHNYQSVRQIGSYLRRFVKTLRPVSLKIGSYPVRRETVLATMEMLANYYVCVALW